MRRLMGAIQDRHGTHYAQQRVPERLQEGVARVLGSIASASLIFDQKHRLEFMRRVLENRCDSEFA